MIGNHSNNINVFNDGYVNVAHIGDFYNGPLSNGRYSVLCKRLGNWYYPNEYPLQILLQEATVGVTSLAEIKALVL